MNSLEKMQLRMLVLKYPEEVKNLTLTSLQVELLKFVQSQGSVLTSEVALQFDTSTASAGGRLKQLLNKGYLSRQEVSSLSGGIEHVYRCIEVNV